MASTIVPGNILSEPNNSLLADDVRTELTAAAADINALQSAPFGAPTTVAAAGSTNADATDMALGIVVVTAGDGTKGTKLPTAAAGNVVIVKNNAAAILKVYPNTSDQINALTVTTGAISMAANTCAMFVATSATNWYTLPLLPS